MDDIFRSMITATDMLKITQEAKQKIAEIKRKKEEDRINAAKSIIRADITKLNLLIKEKAKNGETQVNQNDFDFTCQNFDVIIEFLEQYKNIGYLVETRINTRCAQIYWSIKWGSDDEDNSDDDN